MLSRTPLTLAAVGMVFIAGPVAAGDGDSGSSQWFEESGTGVELGIKQEGQSDRGDRPANVERRKGGNEGELTIDAALVNLCAGKLSKSQLTPDDILVCLRSDNSAGPVDAAALARTIRDRLYLATPQIHTSPEAPVEALVGLETWMWVPSSQWTALTESATLGGTTVTVEAEPISTRWDMGEATKFCPNPGRVWRSGLGQDATTPCGYTYEHTSLGEPESKYRISGQIRYAVTWTCSGACSASSGNLGTIDSAATTAALEVSERHSVVIR